MFGKWQVYLKLIVNYLLFFNTNVSAVDIKITHKRRSTMNPFRKAIFIRSLLWTGIPEAGSWIGWVFFWLIMIKGSHKNKKKIGEETIPDSTKYKITFPKFHINSQQLWKWKLQSTDWRSETTIIPVSLYLSLFV